MNSVYGTYNAVHTGRKDGCVHGTRPCTGRVHGRDQVTDGPRTWSVRDRVHGRVYCRVDGRVYGPCARRCTYRVYGRVHGRSRRVRTVYTGVQRPCT